MGVRMMEPTDCRLTPPTWDAAETQYRRVRWLVLLNAALAAWYFSWLLQPERVGNPILYWVLVSVEAFNLLQAAGFWWTCSRERAHRFTPPPLPAAVDVLIPVYNEPIEIVEPTVAAAMAIRGADVRVALLDDYGRSDLAELAHRHGARYVRRADNKGAKAGNINHALGLTDAPFVAIFDCDHVPDPGFLERTLGHFADDQVALVQTPQYYANAQQNAIAGAAWSQQALFFGAIARGKDARGSMFCCGTNMVLRRTALESVGGFPEGSVTEDFMLSVRLHERRWRSVYVPEVLAQGLGPEDMSSYVGQQLRWARGCLGAIATSLWSRLGLRLRVQYLLSSLFFLSGWTFLVYMSLPIIRMVVGSQPLAEASADQFIARFLPYFVASLTTVATAGGGAYTFAAFSLLAASFWIHIQASIAALLRRPARFVVTPKSSVSGVHARAVAPTLVILAALAAASVYALATDRGPSSLNNVGFAVLHIIVLSRGVLPALWPAWNVLSDADAAQDRVKAPAPARDVAPLLTAPALAHMRPTQELVVSKEET